MAGKVEPRTSNETMSPVGRSVPVINAQFFLTPYVQRGILIFFFTLTHFTGQYFVVSGIFNGDLIHIFPILH